MAKLMISSSRSIYDVSLKQILKCQKSLASVQQRCFCSGERIIDPEDLTPPIPPYSERTGETIQLKRARLLYQSRKRGMLENGLLLGTFAGKFLDSFTEGQLTSYDRLINKPTNDWEIYYWATGVKEIPEEYSTDVMDLLKAHTKNEERASRITQPDLP